MKAGVLEEKIRKGKLSQKKPQYGNSMEMSAKYNRIGMRIRLFLQEII